MCAEHLTDMRVRMREPPLSGEGGSRGKAEGGFMCRPPTVKLAQQIRILGHF